MKRAGIVEIVLAAALIGLIFLWLRENEMRASAQKKLDALQTKTASVLNEKGEVIADLSVQVGELQASMQKSTEEYSAQVQDREEQIAMLNENSRIAEAESEAALKQKDDSIASLETE